MLPSCQVVGHTIEATWPGPLQRYIMHIRFPIIAKLTRHFESAQIKPHPDFQQVVGYSIEAGLAAAAAAPITLDEVEKELAASNNHAYTQLLEERAAAQAAAHARAQEPPADATALRTGPALSMAAGRLTLCAAAGGAIATEGLEVSNSGSTVLFYRWEREGKELEEERKVDQQRRFYQVDMSGVLQPGERKGFGFSFRSAEPGTWLESWRLVTDPAVLPPVEPLILKVWKELFSDLLKSQC
jgi:hypothetical protein